MNSKQLILNELIYSFPYIENNEILKTHRLFIGPQFLIAGVGYAYCNHEPLLYNMMANLQGLYTGRMTGVEEPHRDPL